MRPSDCRPIRLSCDRGTEGLPHNHAFSHPDVTTDPRRARYEQWMFFVPATLEPPGFEVLLHTQILSENKRTSDIAPFATKGYQRVLRVLSNELDHDGYRPGEQFTCADIMPGATLTWLPVTRLHSARHGPSGLPARH
jgi:glutathione S-transferase